MAELLIGLDLSKPAGQQLAPQVRAEIAEVAPSVVVNGSITTAKLAPDAVTGPKLAPGAVDTVRIATNGVETVNVQNGAISTAKLADGAVTLEKAGPGVMAVVDVAGDALQVTAMKLTAAQYAAITTPDPNTWYFITD